MSAILKFSAITMFAKPSFWYTLVNSVIFSINSEIPDCSLKTFVSVQKSTLFDQRMLFTVVAYKNKYLHKNLSLIFLSTELKAYSDKI